MQKDRDEAEYDVEVSVACKRKIYDEAEKLNNEKG